MRGTQVFFVACLAISAALLLAVGVSTMPPRSMPAAAAAGAAVWRAYRCEGCHTLFGQGGAYAPDITRSYGQRGPDYLREFLVNPSAFHPGARVMPALGLTRTETDHLLAFLQWVDGQNTGWPPRPLRVAGGADTEVSVASADTTASLPAEPAARGEYWFKRPPAICATCHALTPNTVIVGPSLAGIASRAADRVPGMAAEAYLRESILNPGAFVVPGFPDAMQKNLGEHLSAEQINDIIAFLLTLE
ncbi:MAG: c-type cytochrome [Chloroflexi bacterium]|nr:c-type cytochrome [Chloroflexota bacterium]